MDPDRQGVILVVDDDSVALRLMTRMLAPRDYRVLTCRSPLEALAQVAMRRIAVVVSDIEMPEMSGFALMRQLHKQHPEIPVILMTGHAGADFASMSMDHGAFAFLEKPFGILSLRHLVDSAWGSYLAAQAGP